MHTNTVVRLAKHLMTDANATWSKMIMLQSLLYLGKEFSNLPCKEEEDEEKESNDSLPTVDGNVNGKTNVLSFILY